jgi:hypothetical protein
MGNGGMREFEWLVVAGSLTLGGFTFLRLVAAARQAVVAQAQAERLRRQREAAEEAARSKAEPEAAQGVVEAVDVQ